MREKKQPLAHHKAELNWKTVQYAKFVIGEYITDLKHANWHLGVMLDERVKLNNHVDYI